MRCVGWREESEAEAEADAGALTRCGLQEENILRRPRIEGRDDPGKGQEKNAFRKMLEGLEKAPFFSSFFSFSLSLSLYLFCSECDRACSDTAAGAQDDVAVSQTDVDILIFSAT